MEVGRSLSLALRAPKLDLWASYLVGPICRLVPLGVLKSQIITIRIIAVSFRVLSLKSMTGT